MSEQLALASVRMGRRLTTPFLRGADTLTLSLLGAQPPQDTTHAEVVPYDFAEHEARFGWTAQPRYLLRALRDLPVATRAAVSYRVADGPEQHESVGLPAGTLAGSSFAVSLPISTDVRVTALVVPAGDGPAAGCWEITALLGITSALLWVLGQERDEIRRQFARVVDQRHLPRAVGPSLDLIGADLGVPRFPPLPYGVDADVVALYHLDEVAGPTVADRTSGYPGFTGHPGVAAGVEFGLAGRYGPAIGLRAADATVEVPSSVEFDIAAQAGATFECFVRPDPGGGQGPVLSRQATPGADDPGWAVEIGDFGRGVADNVRLTVADGSHPSIALYADVSLTSTAFSHVAAVLDRAADRLTLFVNGQPVASRTPTGLGAIANTEPLVIGWQTGGFRGSVDEVRISRVARPDFAPALGERDDHYRRRLEVFRRWSLPTPGNLETVLNEVVGPIGGIVKPLLVEDANAAVVRGSRLVRVRPVVLLPGETMDGAGQRRAVEAEVVGTAAAEDGFDQALLLQLTRPDIDYADPLPRIQVGLADPLAALVDLAAAEPGPPGRLRIPSAYTAGADDLRAVGRAVLLTHSTLAPDRLSALAHRAGFDFVRHAPGGLVYAAVAPGEYFVLDPTAAGDGPTDLAVGESRTLELRPVPPGDAIVQWLVVPCGPGAATVTGQPGASTVTALAPGRAVVRADVTWQHRTYSATRIMQIGLDELADGASVAADGTLDAPETVLGEPDGYFHPAFLTVHDDSRVDYGGQADHHRMQPVLAGLLDALLAELDRRGIAGPLRVTAAYHPAGDRAESQGRALTLRHATLSAGQLAGLTYAVGFGHTRRTGETVQVRHGAGQLVTVHGPAADNRSVVLEVDEGGSVEVTAAPTPAQLLAAGVSGPAAGVPPRLSWATGAFAAAAARLGSTTQPVAPLTGLSAGLVWVQAGYLVGDAPAPYTFGVRLVPELDVPATVLSKDQYDLIMNVLNTLHPIGVEVSTAAIRAHVVEVQGDLMAANPDYTYPKFRMRTGLRPRRKGPTS